MRPLGVFIFFDYELNLGASNKKYDIRAPFRQKDDISILENLRSDGGGNAKISIIKIFLTLKN
jgi:hypothetical protein